jgi:urea transport system permease protein
MYNYLTSEHDYGYFSWSPDYWPIFLGVAFVLVVLFLPNGLIEVVDRFKEKFGKSSNSNSIEKA